MTIARKGIRQDQFRTDILCSATELAREMTRLKNNVRSFPSMVFDHGALEWVLGPHPMDYARSREIGQH
jgi:hypothetical protein